MVTFVLSKYYEKFITMLDTERGKYTIHHFADGEPQAVVKTTVTGQECCVIGSIMPSYQLVELLLLADALKNNGATKVTAVLPYMAFTRQDKFASNESTGVALISKLFQAAGIDKVITLDIHSQLDQELSTVELTSLSPAPLFAKALGEVDKATCIVAPDTGAKQRSQRLSEVLGISAQAYLQKEHTDGIAHIGLKGAISPHAIVVDDVIDTGKTFRSACKVLRENGVEKITLVVTHGILSDNNWRKLFDLGVERMLVTDSCPQVLEQNDPRINIVPLASLFHKIDTLYK